MANAEHMALAKQGSKVIAEWRRSHLGTRVDLSEANLREADLGGADLCEADLSEASLFKANLRRANLAEANLKAAELDGANLSDANLTEAQLVAAHLVGANLRGADLSGANLGRAHLLTADFRGAKLMYANLSGVNLTWANLSKANLADSALVNAELARANFSGACLSKAQLIMANLSEADLSAADLGGANLGNATLSELNLSGARLSEAWFGLTSLLNVDLSQAVELANARHHSPSNVGVDTLIVSFRGAGNKLTPELVTFFRGAGVPQELLDALPGIVAEVKYYSCFISYGQSELEFATRLTEDLKARSVSCWLYEMDKATEERTWREMGMRRREAEKMVLLCSAGALVRDGVLKEVEEQMDEGPNKLLPISLDDLWREPGFKVRWGSRDLKPFLLERNCADFTNQPYEKALEALLRGLRRKAGRRAEA